MHRLSPLIVRQVRNPGRPFADWPGLVEAPKSKLSDDVQLFLTAWLGGLVFFGTFLL